MTTLLSLSRAAQLLGVTRASLQGRIREGRLVSFDGQVALADLRAVYPDLEIDSSGAFERVTEIKEHAFGRRIRERALPSQEILAQRIFQQSEELADLRRHLQGYHALLQFLRNRIDDAPPDALRDDLRDAIDEGLAEILASESATGDHLAAMQDMLKMVSAQVTVRPSGHEFIVEGQDTLLQAGLKAGLRLNYGCGSGNCGLCKTRVVSGEVRQIIPSTYPLSDAERASGHVLACSCAPITDLIIESLEAEGPADIPAQSITATVRGLRASADPAAPLQLHLQTPRSNRLRFLAGQSVTLGIAAPGGDLTTTWPIASCPCDDRNLHFHVSNAPDDALASALFAGQIRIGDTINLRGPLGDFVLDPESPRPLVFIASGTGFAPIKSLIEHAMAIDTNDIFGLVWVADSGGHYLDNLCRMWAGAFDRFSYHPLPASPTDDHTDAAMRALAAARTQLPYLAEADLYVAGPAGFVAALSAQLSTDAPPNQHICTTIV